MFDFLVGSGATVATEFLAAYKGDLAQIRNLIENGKAQRGFDQGLTLLHAAAAGGHRAIVEALLASGLDVNTKTQEGYTALHYAAAANRRTVAELLLDKGANISARAGIQTPLHWAVREHHRDMVEWLLTRGADPNAQGGGATPLHWAVWRSYTDIAALLVSHGGDILIKTEAYRWTPLSEAADMCTATTLLLMDTAVDRRAAARWAPLHAAVLCRSMQAVKWLLAHGADINAKDERGLTALHQACQRGLNDMAELLIANGGDIKAKTDQGETSVTLARKNGHTEILELLRKHGAKE